MRMNAHRDPSGDHAGCSRMFERRQDLPRIRPHDQDRGLATGPSERQVSSIRAPGPAELGKAGAHLVIQLEIRRCPEKPLPIDRVLDHDFKSTALARLVRLHRLGDETPERDRLPLRTPRRGRERPARFLDQHRGFMISMRSPDLINRLGNRGFPFANPPRASRRVASVRRVEQPAGSQMIVAPGSATTV